MCLRRISKIQPSFISRISNETVFARTGQEKLSAVFRRRQVQAYQKVRAMPVASPVRRLVCNAIGSPIIWNRCRKRGRPRQTWSESVSKLTN